MTKKIYKVGGLFSGVGGIESGFSLKDKFEIKWASDLDKYSARTYRKNYSHSFIEKDINNLKGSELEEVDVLVGGFPCQAFSVAGYQKGFEDERGEVFFQIIRIINELPSKPKVLLLENVKNIFTHDKKNTFMVIQDALEKTGYCVFSKILNTCEYTSIPQNRERTFIVCFLEDKDAFIDPSKPMSTKFKFAFPPTKLNKTRPIKDFLEKDEVDEKYYYRQDKYNYKELVKSITKKDTFYQWRRVYVRENKSGVCPTLTANMGTGGHNVPLIKDDYGIRKLTPRECFNLQGFPNDFKFPDDVPNSQLYKQAGNSVTVEMIKKVAEVIYESLSNSD
ncbi:DNA (cytosine-5-)-methyltransferase [Alphaproteobacteria bacterium]|nr:DNA (cytosine-5-)-methyltransferase [Alphaproteobacteria bacterium]MDC0549044.1 DNA (cytosine-5-)-methyltransferase [Alphaproteobacteria bacterium]